MKRLALCLFDWPYCRLQFLCSTEARFSVPTDFVEASRAIAVKDWSERGEGHRRRRARSGLEGGEHDVSVGQVGKGLPQAGAAADALRGARPFDGRPGASRLFGGRCRATCPRC